MTGLRVVSAIMFSPRGGSAHAARALSEGLRRGGASVTLVAGSRRDQGRHGDAAAFYDHVQVVDFGPALAGPDPLRYEGPVGTAPMHPSFEDRPGAPDRVFAALGELEFELQVSAWCRALERAGAPHADVLHLHHLTPINEAAARVAPYVPVVGQLHGTELLMLERIAAGARAEWSHAEPWAARMRAWAHRCERLVVAPAGVERAVSVLGVPRNKVVAISNGVDLELFSPQSVDRAAFWRRVLVEDPQGWLPGKPAGSACYDSAEVGHWLAGTVLLYVGRFTAVKRLDRLIEAFARAQLSLSAPAALVLVGGHPGEWENEHPAEIVARLRVAGVFLAGWHCHAELPEFFAAADAVALSSENEQFGQVLVEAMACGLPPIASRSPGPESIIEAGRTGWLVPAADPGALAAALTAAIRDPAERRRRGDAAAATVRSRYSWDGIAGELSSVLASAAGARLTAEAI